MERIGRIGRGDVEPRPVPVQHEYVARNTATTAAQRRPSMLLVLILLLRGHGRDPDDLGRLGATAAAAAIGSKVN